MAVDLVYHDLLKAFDKVKYAKLIDTLHLIVINGSTYNDDNAEVCSDLERSIAKLYDYASSWNLTMTNIDK